MPNLTGKLPNLATLDGRRLWYKCYVAMVLKRLFNLAFKPCMVAYTKDFSAGYFGMDPKHVREWPKQIGDIRKTAAETGKQFPLILSAFF